MNITKLSDILNGDTIGFSVAGGDKLRFDTVLLGAFNLNFEPNGADIVFTIRDNSGAVVKSFTLLNVQPYEMSSSMFMFDNGSTFQLGDNSSATGDDAATWNLTGTLQGDMLITAGGGQLVLGDAGNDSLATVGAFGGGQSGPTGVDTLDGGAGNDWLSLAGVYDAQKYTLTLNGSSDATLSILGAGDVPVANSSAVVRNIENVDGSDVVDIITGDTNANRLAGNGGADSLTGGDGDDTLVGGQGNDTLSGGVGFDTVDYSDDPNLDGNNLGVVVNLSGGVQQNYTWNSVLVGPVAIGTAVDGWGNTDTFGNRDEIEGIRGSAYNDVLIGNGFANNINGGDGSDLLVGLNGNDTLDGGTTGPSKYFDWVSYSSAAQNGTTGVTGVTVNLGAGTASGKPSPGTGSVDSDTLLNIDGVTGSSFNDSLTGGSSSQWFNGDKYEWFQGGAGSDTIDGGRANNAIAMDAANLEFNWARYAGVNGQVIVNLANNAATADGQSGQDTLIGINAVWGGNAADSLTGGNALFDYVEVFNGSGGDDTITGGTGRNVAAYRDSTEGVTVVLDTDNVLGNGYAGTAIDGIDKDAGTAGMQAGTDTLIDINVVTGSDFNDTFTGGAGDDQFQGRKGDDNINGGGGSDYVDYHSDENANGDLLGVVVNLGGTTTTGNWQGLGYSVAASSALDGFGNTDTLLNIENIRGSIYADVLIGDGGDNLIRGQAGSDKIDGGAGNDTALYDGPSTNYNVVNQGGGVWTVAGIAGVDMGATDTLTNIETIQFENGSQSLTGGPAAYNFDTMTDGQAVSFDPANDTFNSPTLGIQNFDIGPIETGLNAGRGLELRQMNQATHQTVKTVQLLFTGGVDATNMFKVNSAHITFASSKLLLGDDLATTGDDTTTVTLTGTAGNDLLITAGGSQTLDGGDGNDVFVTLQRQTGDGSNGTDVFNGGNGTDTLQLDSGRLTGGGVITQYTVDLAGTGSVTTTGNLNNSSFTLSSIENVEGSDVADHITGTSGNNLLKGGAGNDTLLGGAGNDSLDGGAGSDSIDGGTGFDRLDYSSNEVSGTAISVNLTTHQVTQGADTDTVLNVERVVGTSQADTLTGDANNILTYTLSDLPITFEGMAGNDTINGGTSAPSSFVTVDYSGAQQAVNVNLGTGTASNDGFGNADMLSNIDAVVGSALNDSITGGGSSAQILSGNHFEHFEGGLGSDTIDGGEGVDRVSYQNNPGAVTVTLVDGAAAGSALETNVPGGTSTDTLYGIEQIRGSAFADTLNGNSGNNVIEGMAGNDAINGGGGFDQARYSRSTTAINATFTSGGAGTVTDGLGGTDTLTGIEEIYGSDFADTLTGGSSNDSFVGMKGADTMDGGAGFDRASYTTGPLNTGVTVTLAGTAGNITGTATDQYGETDTLISIESIQGSHFADTLTGTADHAQTYLLNDFPELFEGMGGNDTINGGTSAPTHFAQVTYASSGSGVTVNLGTGTASDGFGGTDTLSNIDGVIGSSFSDSITGGSSSAQIVAGALFEQFEGGGGDDTIDGGSGTDRAVYSSAGAAVTVVLDTDQINNGYTGTATGGAGNDVLISIEHVRGSNFGDDLTGGGGNDAFEGGGGNDVIHGMAGFDTLRFDRSTSAVTVTFTAAGTGTVDDGLGGTDSFDGIEAARGSDNNDTLNGSSGDEQFEGMAGNDQINGGAGNDRVSYSSNLSGVTVTLAAGAASVTDSWGGTDSLTSIENITGSQFADSLTGDAGNNNISGLDGNDSITGGLGSDTLDGGTGTDIAYYSGNKADYTITSTGGSGYTVVGIAGADNGTTDILSNIETLQFADQSYSLPVTGAVWNFDTMTDGQAVSFDPTTDTFNSPTLGIQNFDIGPIETGLSAGRGLELRQMNQATHQTVKTVQLLFTGGADATNMFKVNSAHITFAGSKLLVGDDLATTGDDTTTVTLTGTAGNDLLITAGGSQTLDGGDGNDIFVTLQKQAGDGSNGTDVFNGGIGTDTLQLDSGRLTGGGVITQYTVDLAGTGSVTTTGNLYNSTFTLSSIENVEGSDVADHITGTSGNNLLKGGAGNDTLLGGAGNDSLDGGAGSDSIDGGTGFDRLDYSSNEVSGTAISVNLTTHQVTQGADTDTVLNVERVVGTSQADTLTGDANNILTYTLSDLPITFEGMAGNDTINGGTSAPSSFVTVDYSGAQQAVNVNLGTGTASNDGFGNADMLSNIDAVVGSALNDSITGGGSSAQILSGNHFEHFEGGLGSDTIDGGEGVDRVSYQNNPGAVTVTLVDGAAAGSALETNVPGGTSTDTLYGIEQIRGSAFADTLNGNSGNNVIEGMAGNDAINGGGGFDQARYSRSTTAINATFTSGGAGTVVDGLGGTDTLSGIEEIYGSDFADTLTGGSSNDSFVGMKGADTMDGGAGFDRASYSTGPMNTGVTVTLAGTAGNITGTATDQYGDTDTLISIESIQGSHFADTLTGTADHAQTYLLNDFPELFEGLGGNDTINGGTSAPTHFAQVTYANSGSGVTVNLGTGIASDGFGGTDTLSNIDGVIGSNFSDSITGGSNSAQIVAGALFEQFEGGGGDDTIDGGSGTDRAVYSSAGAAVTVVLDTDQINNGYTGTATGGAGNDVLISIEHVRGSNFGDDLTGGGGNDAFEGGGGNDVIHGMAGFDTLRFDRSTSAVTVTFTTAGTGTVDDGLGGTDSFDGIEAVRGSDYNDIFNGSSGDEQFEGMAGNDQINGGAGNDRVSYASNLSGVTVTLAAGAASVTDSWGGTDSLTSIENITGSQFADSLTGDAGNNILQGLGGNDTISGGTGIDIAVYSGLKADYTITKTGAGQYTLTDNNLANGNEGTDTLNGIEQLQFSDLAVNLKAKISSDFNGDGKSDILLRNSTDGMVVQWQMNGGVVGGGGVVDTLPSNWSIVDAQGDYNGDGKADVLLRNGTDGMIVAWQMNGSQVASSSVVNTLPPSWTIVDARADYNGDGTSDILLRNSTDGAVVQWLMNGGQVATSTVINTLPSSWSILDSRSDFDGDGKSDILLRNATDGMVVEWQMNGSSVGASAVINTLPASWTVVDSHADYNGDGKADILLRNSADGMVVAWQMNGTQVGASSVLATLPSSWEVIDTRGDYNGDGNSDILLKNSTDGMVVEWLMSGTQIGTSSVLTNLPNNWAIVNAHGDYNGDGMSDVLLRNSTDGMVVAWQMNGTQIAASTIVNTVPSNWSFVDAPATPTGQVLNGDVGNNSLVGGTGDDVLNGLEGNDTLTGGAGNDELNGGLGQDTAVFSGTKAAYTVTHTASGYTVSGSADGSDTLTGIEWLQFNDGLVKLGATPGVDANGDGKSDLLLRNATDGMVVMWQMNGGQIGSSGVLANLPSSWSVASAQGDFNGDGKTDILLRNSADGMVVDWQMDGTQIGSSGVLANLPSGWSFVDTRGDYDGDGKNDILLRNSSDGMVVQWQMNGTQIGVSSVLNYVPGNWTIVDAHSDFSGDGKSDILLQNSTDGMVVMWQMNGTQVASSGVLATLPGTWSFVETHGDYNGDGKSDILLRNSADGMVVDWQMDGPQIASSGVVNFLPSNWTVVDARGDYNGDGKSDILLRNSTDGMVVTWEMNGNLVAGTGVLANLPSAWAIVDGHSDFTGDGKSDILLRNSTDGMVVEWEMNGGQVAASTVVATLPSDWGFIG